MDGIQNIRDADGLGIALTGMVIVFSGLALITLFIAILPKALAQLAPYLPPEGAGHGAVARPPAQAAPAADEGELLAAIGYALHVELESRS
jgi:Na+-transporting methylmalonyl-CoA/oxaloacetate decarboxylase gamma subunit